MMATLNKIKVLIIDHDIQLARRINEFISRHGFEGQVATNIQDARRLLWEWHPKVVISDIFLTDGSAFEILHLIKSDESLKYDFSAFIILSAHNHIHNIRQAIEQGVDDYMVKPIEHENLLKRLVYHCRSFRRIAEVQKKEIESLDDSSLMLHLSNLVLKQSLWGRNLETALHNLTQMLSMKMEGVRCSIIECVEEDQGIVVTSNDNKRASGIQLDLNKYPEVLHVRNTQMMIAIENLQKDKHLKFIKDQVKDIQFNSMIVCPLFHDQRFFGVLSLRLPANKIHITDNELRFSEIVSQAVSLTLNRKDYFDNSYWKNKAA